MITCDVVKDNDAGSSLCCAFVVVSKNECCTEACFKINNALIDDRRIKV